ncbi:MAG: trypsin-like peptidase domain-containing protein, partial [Planctomycetes bacterium]|nr:trypsin-like peptidase domain-containing protein [Planctomycetota bacterium]
GIIVSTSGLVLTVDSGLLNSQNVRAQMSDGSQFEVELVQSDHGLQLALLQLKPSNIIENEPGTIRYPFVELEHSTRPTIGETVYACGNPFKVAARGEDISFSKGVYCGTTKLDATRGTVDFPYRGDVLVIDAITSTPGFSGGGLINKTVGARRTKCRIAIDAHAVELRHSRGCTRSVCSTNDPSERNRWRQSRRSAKQETGLPRYQILRDGLSIEPRVCGARASSIPGCSGGCSQR